MLDKEGQQRTFNQFMELFVLPEITRRKEAGVLPDKFVLNAAQVIFYDDGRRPLVRLNEDAKILAKIKLKNGVNKEKGEDVFQNEIEKLETLRLMDEEESKYAHISIIRFKNHWILGFDFRYNKKLARDHFKTAAQFYSSAQNAYQNNLMVPFIDNLFSAIELLAKSELLLMPDEEFKKKTTHKGIQIKYSKFVDIGNAKLDYKKSLNKLSGLRTSARYLKSDFQLSETEAQEYLEVVKEMLDYLEFKLSKIE